MPRYCIVLSPQREDLYQALVEAFKDRKDFVVIRERRSDQSSGGRRRALVWQGDGLTIAEQRETEEE